MLQLYDVQCTKVLRVTQAASTPFVHWNWMELLWKVVTRKELNHLYLKTYFYLANFVFPAMLNQQCFLLWGLWEENHNATIWARVSWQWKPYSFFKIHVGLGLEHSVTDFQFRSYEYNWVIPTHFLCGWIYDGKNIPLIRRTWVLALRDSLNKNRTQGQSRKAGDNTGCISFFTRYLFLS